VAIAAARAETTVVGNASQSSSQTSTMSQSANNHVSPLPVVGATTAPAARPASRR
jgi:hypothetical protein